jgi:hypothetical protein
MAYQAPVRSARNTVEELVAHCLSRCSRPSVAMGIWQASHRGESQSAISTTHMEKMSEVLIPFTFDLSEVERDDLCTHLSGMPGPTARQSTTRGRISRSR